MRFSRIRFIAALLVGSAISSGGAMAEGDGEIEFEAAQLIYDNERNTITALGDVIVRFKGYVLRAAVVDYDQTTGRVTARNGLTIEDGSGTVIEAEEAELTDELRDGFIRNVQIILADGARIAAREAVREGGRRTELSNAVYSPCEICNEEGRKAPLWQIKAVRVVHDQDKQRIYYKDAYLEFLGVPLVYLPWFSHPDPTVERESGFLVPDVKVRQELGVVIPVPYHFVFDQSSDATLTPMLSTKEGLILAGQYRKHYGPGQIQFDGSITYTDERNDLNMRTGREEFRGHLFSTGSFRHSRRWQSHYQLEWASDDTYLRRYDFSTEDTLTSQYRLDGIYGRSHIRAETLYFDGLRLQDRSGKSAFALPLIDAEYVSKPSQYGTFRAGANAMMLHRTNGMDTRRVSVSGNWERRFLTRLGQEVRFATDMRADMYHVTDAALPDNPLFAGEDGFTFRALPQASMTVSWPFAQFTGSHQQIFEPIVSIVAAPNGGNPSGIPNEDSRAFELADTNIFADKRFPGLDRWESGSRVTYGVKWNFYSDLIQSEVQFGQTYRFGNQPTVFPDGTGLFGRFSDFVGRWEVKLADRINFYHRFRLDKDSLALRRNEIDVQIESKRGDLSFGYFRLDRDLEEFDLEDREEVRVSGSLRFNDRWSLQGFVTEDLTFGADPVSHGGALIYTDECLEFSISYRRSYTIDRDIVPGTSFSIRFKLKNLG